MRYFDAHSHIHFKEFAEDIGDVLVRMSEMEVGTITVGVDSAWSAKGVEFANSHENVWATVGLHPADNRAEVFDMNVFRALAQNPKVVGIGECGLDYFRIKPGIEESEKKRQKEIFLQQINLAKEVGKPLMIHCRDAHEDVIAMLRESGVSAVIHFFTGSLEEARQYLELGCHLSFSGVVTFAPMYEELLRVVPMDRILTETDAPYATPVPLRGKRNEPSFVPYTLAHIAKVKGIPEEDMRLQVLENVSRAFPALRLQ